MRTTSIVFVAALMGALAHVGSQSLCAAAEPELPAGLEEPETKPATNEPDLPSGLESTDATAPGLPAGLESTDATAPGLPAGLETGEPGLPSGLEGGSADKSAQQHARKPTPLEILKDAGFSGFLEARGGVRTQSDPHEKEASIGETRLQVEWQKNIERFRMKFTGDFIYDQVDNELGDIDLRRGRGWFDLREGWIGFSPLEWMDVKLGRQILTWGTGDLLFVNDLFPKDWQAFFIGRDLEYLKAPSDAMKISAFSGIVDVDFVYIPLMNPSRFISGRRISYFNRNLGRLAGRDTIVRDDLPSEWFRDGEYAARLSRRFGSYELAACGFWGHYKTPEGFDMARNKAVYPRLNAYGGSVRGPFWRGIGNFEAAYYDSSQDRDGDDPMTPNSQLRLLGGYEMDLPQIAKELTVGVQYYVEIMMNHDEYVRALPPGSSVADKDRHVLTFRVTKQLLNQDLTLGLFTYYSPTDSDAYMRPNVKYKIDDHWTAEVGGNVFFGQRTDTFFGQFRRDSNVYVSLRCAF